MHRSVQEASQNRGISFDRISGEMKLRLKNNSIRLRLTRSEVEQLDRTGTVEESIVFGPDPHQPLTYSVKAVSETDGIQADFIDNRITVVVPRANVDDWTGSTKIELQGEQVIGNGGTLRILIEKDFACLKPRAGEDDADAFPNPLSQGAC